MKNGGDGGGEGGGDGSDTKVIVEQTLLKINEVFVYRIPPMRSADGHRAEDWNLAKPLHPDGNCKLEVVRVDDALHVNIHAERPKPNAVPPGATEWHLFARCEAEVNLNDPGRATEHWVDPVIDSSRYFALRISDPRTGRTAFVGVGFRERMDATDFRGSLRDYENSLRRDQRAADMHKQFEETERARTSSLGDGEIDDGRDGSQSSPLPPALSKLSLKEGEKIHINIKGQNDSGDREKSATTKKSSGGGGVLLKKPPPPGRSPTFASTSVVPQNLPVAEEDAVADANVDEAANDAPSEGVVEAPGDDNDDDEWGDFEG